MMSRFFGTLSRSTFWRFFMVYRFLAVVSILVILSACAGELDAGAGVSGTWNGQITQSGAPITLELTQTGTNITGTLTSSAGILPEQMSGTAAGNLVSLSNQAAEGDRLVQIEASVSGDTMQGTLAVTEAGDISSSTFTASR
jgi:hypothetical protein